MNCLEFERVLLEGEQTPEQQAHLNSCPACSNLLSDLDLISSQAKLLLAAEEPSPAVWNAIEARLRREGLIRGPELPKPSFNPFVRWRAAWLVPAAAVLLVGVGLRLHSPSKAGDNATTAVTAPTQATTAAKVSGDDQELLDNVASRPPAQQAKYRADLDNANAFIRDAQRAAQSDPTDVYRQQMLMNAYEQKEMLYDLTVNHVAEQ